jgi:hypothetical protein
MNWVRTVNWVWGWDWLWDLHVLDNLDWVRLWDGMRHLHVLDDFDWVWLWPEMVKHRGHFRKHSLLSNDVILHVLNDLNWVWCWPKGSKSKIFVIKKLIKSFPRSFAGCFAYTRTSNGTFLLGGKVKS